MQVYGSEDRRIDGILALIEESSRVAPLPEVLQRMCEQVAAIAHAEVVSVYVREQEGEHPTLILRANVGFSREMIGNVKLELGEGITGFAAECLRPVSSAVAQRDQHYKHVPELGEERFPTFLSLPLVIGGRAIGVLNLQRREGGDFSPAEVALAAALATPFTLALDRATNRATATPPEHDLGRSARLTGTMVSPGQTMGKAQGSLTFRALVEPTGPGPAARELVDNAVTRVTEQIMRTTARLDAELTPDSRRALAGLQVTLQDARLLSLLGSTCAELGVVAGLRKVARDYVAAPYMVGGERSVDPWMSARAGEIEDLCLWLAGEATHDHGPGPGSISVIAERLGAFTVIWALARGVSGIVVGANVEAESLAAGLARAGKLPIVSEVAGLFAWVRSGDTVLVDAGQGIVRVNPSASALAQYRHAK
ncbi:MAG: Phosphocarrier protein kinase/phosphorylase [Myxococcaceae bacterium]|nr:Phosphocarrier protein kinase/phosphorylase [Myxococcaceae bacterium]